MLQSLVQYGALQILSYFAFLAPQMNLFNTGRPFALFWFPFLGLPEWSSQGLPCLFTILRDCFLPNNCYLESCCFIYFVFFICFRQEGESGPYSSILNQRRNSWSILSQYSLALIIVTGTKNLHFMILLSLRNH